MRRSVLFRALIVPCLWPVCAQAQLQSLKFDRPTNADFFTATRPAGMATLRTKQEWSVFARQHWRPSGQGDTVPPPQLDFKRFMAVALWHPGYSGCQDYRDWVDSVLAAPDTIRVYVSIPPNGPCQALVNSFDMICLAKDHRPVAITEDMSRRSLKMLDTSPPPKLRSGSRGWCG